MGRWIWGNSLCILRPRSKTSTAELESTAVARIGRWIDQFAVPPESHRFRSKSSCGGERLRPLRRPGRVYPNSHPWITNAVRSALSTQTLRQDCRRSRSHPQRFFFFFFPCSMWPAHPGDTSPFAHRTPNGSTIPPIFGRPVVCLGKFPIEAPLGHREWEILLKTKRRRGMCRLGCPVPHKASQSNFLVTMIRGGPRKR
jgi:hypothetical protein